MVQGKKTRDPKTYDTNNYFSMAEAAALFYITLPLALFFAFFIRWAIALPALLLIAYFFYHIVLHTKIFNPPWLWSSWSRPKIWPLLCLAGLAALWVYLVGGFGGGTGQANDWYKHYAIINLLLGHDWPPVITQSEWNGQPYLLRYYLGYYLVPSGLLKIGLSYLFGTRFFFGLWSFLGVFIFFVLIHDWSQGWVAKRTKATTHPKKIFYWHLPIIFIFFSGLDVIGGLITHSLHNVPYLHFENWHAIEYSSNTTLLTWVPQHALAAWLSIMLLLRADKNPSSPLLPLMGFVAAATALWSSFTFLGLMPFALLVIHRNQQWRLLYDWRIIAAGVCLLAPIVLYLSLDNNTIPSGFAFRLRWTLGAIVFKFGIIAMLLWFHYRPQPTSTNYKFLQMAIIILLLVPFYYIGSDFRRVAVPALALLPLLASRALTSSPMSLRTALVIYLLLAIPTPLAQITRSFLFTRNLAQETFATALRNVKETYMNEETLHFYLVPPANGQWLIRD